MDSQSLVLAQAVAAQLSRHVTDVVLCPGSRNSPLSLALLAREDIRVHTRIDERTAAFLALGLARVSGRHVAVVMTSGTAVANTLPAMIEAHYSHVPLAIVSADRPQRLVGTGASQTIEQQGIFGVYADTIQVSEAMDIPAMAEAFTSKRQVHINVELDAPLLSDSALDKPSDITQQRAPVAGWVNHGEVEVDLRRNTLVIAGDEAWPVEGLEDVPTIAEPTAPAPYYPVHPAAARVFRKDQVSANDYVVNTRVDQVIVVGHPTLHRDVLALISDPDVDLVCLSRTPQVTNPRGEHARIGTTVKVTGEPTSDWMQICDGAAKAGSDAVREALENDDHGFTGLHAAAAVADTLAVGDAVFIGSSNPIRDMALVGLPFDGVDAFSARGAAGIDGSLSQAIGVAIGIQGRERDVARAPRTVALLGDITFLHDLTGLIIGPDEVRPENLTIVIANDNGGGIFETLETGHNSLRGDFEKAFGTPHDVDIEPIVEGLGLDYRRADTAQELLDTMAELAEFAVGITVVEARVNRSSRRALHEEISSKNAF
ncbi:2-succinyl-5-enolpyruvyl-6-hydroxy-3-cyclohexene-1-carboxylic-acid synthase [Corynebacterium sp. L4756]|uniref:2-succinyl-5-enolpyruvyl-6-hydroxy-3- cyclohexene-1-carboxylic-acid synthase n=1 Tax=unclassified Corynebacterium TaxID=2624378 RepID=UPI00374D9D85